MHITGVAEYSNVYFGFSLIFGLSSILHFVGFLVLNRVGRRRRRKKEGREKMGIEDKACVSRTDVTVTVYFMKIPRVLVVVFGVQRSRIACCVG